MNVAFWFFMLAMLLLAIGIIILPLLRVRNTQHLAYKESNMALYQQKIAELDQDLEEGRLDQEHFKQARRDLDIELLDDVPEASKETAAEHYSMAAVKRPVIALLISLFIPALSFLMYMQLGMHADSDKTVASKQAPLPMSEMISKLEDHLENNEGTAQDWLMLGRAYKISKRYSEAADAFAKSLSKDKNPQTMLEQAEMMAFAKNQRFDAASKKLVIEALILDPENLNAIWFAGIAEFQTGGYWQALDHFSALLNQGENNPESIKLIRSYMEKARELLIAQGEKVDPIDSMLTIVDEPFISQATSKAVSQGASLSVKVSISDDIKSKFSNSDTIFVYAKAANGPPMPLAVQKLKLSDLPTTVTLDDSMAMMDGMNLSAFAKVKVSARVSKSGTAIAQSGDYIGEIVVQDVTVTDKLNIMINVKVP